MVSSFEGFVVPDEKYYVITTPLITNSGVRDIFIAEDRYALLATGSGVDIVDLLCGQTISSATILGTETNTVAADFTTSSGHLYVGTTTSGIYRTRWKNLRAPGTDFSNLLEQRYTTISTPPISSNEVNDIAISVSPVRILISTGSGIDFLTGPGLGDLRSTRVLLSGSEDCELTNNGEGYWTATNSGVEASYDLNSSSQSGIIVVDFEYNATSSTPLLPDNNVGDIQVIEGSPNLLNFATTVGDFVIEESQGSEATSRTKTLLTNDSIVSAAFSNDATFDTTGTKYVTTADTLTVFGLVDDAISGTHQSTIGVGEKFIKENTRDQALLTGTNTIVRLTSVA